MDKNTNYANTTLTDLRDKRTSGARAESARDYLHYYDDYGITTTEDQYKELNSTVENANKSFSDSEKLIADARNSNVSQSWEEYSKDFTLVYVYDGDKGADTAASWYFPQSSMEELYKTLADIGVNVNWNTDTGGINIDNEGYGKEINEALQDSWIEMRNSFDTSNAESIANNETEIAGAESALGIYKGSLEERLAALRSDYDKKISQMNDGALKLGFKNEE